MKVRSRLVLAIAFSALPLAAFAQMQQEPSQSPGWRDRLQSTWSAVTQGGANAPCPTLATGPQGTDCYDVSRMPNGQPNSFETNPPVPAP